MSDDIMSAAKRAAEKCVFASRSRHMERIILAEFAPLLAAKDAEINSLDESAANEIAAHQQTILDRDALAAQVAQCHADASETDQDIRALANRVLPAALVDGDSVCVPPLEEIVEMLVEQVVDLRLSAKKTA